MEKDAVDELLKQPLDKRYCHGLSNKVKMFQTKAETHKESQQKNPFSAQWLKKDRKGVGANHKPQKGDPEYGRPPSGSKSESRGLKAYSHVTKEMLELCEVIHENAEYSDGELDGISFGELFKAEKRAANMQKVEDQWTGKGTSELGPKGPTELGPKTGDRYTSTICHHQRALYREIYTNISNKVVGILLRGRKHEYLHFEGEMLFQRRDDDKIIYLLKPIDEIREIFHSHEEDE